MVYKGQFLYVWKNNGALGSLIKAASRKWLYKIWALVRDNPVRWPRLWSEERGDYKEVWEGIMCRIGPRGSIVWQGAPQTGIEWEGRLCSNPINWLANKTKDGRGLRSRVFGSNYERGVWGQWEGARVLGVYGQGGKRGRRHIREDSCSEFTYQ